MFPFRRQHVSAASLILAVAALRPSLAHTQATPDITKQPTLYVVPYAHLDTQWRWEFPQTISEYLLKTMRVNFDYMQKYPHYIFNWSGSNRYRLMQEYYPADYARLKGYVATGQWFPAGSSVEEGDVNLPSAESIFRQVLYGNTFFRAEFGKASAEYMLPDCFGFPASLPTILAASGVKGFSTQKLSAAWQPAPRIGGPDSIERTPEGIPFNVGLWRGPDGETVLAALNPGNYNGSITSDLSKNPPPAPAALPTSRKRTPEVDWPARIARDGEVTGLFADYHYVGTGDIGGATTEESVKLLEATVTGGQAVLPTTPTRTPAGSTGDIVTAGQPVRMGDGPVKVLSSSAEQMFLDIKPGMQSRLPAYQGDLELINHSAGSLTSQAYHKRWNRKNELLADAAEKASVAAAWLGARPYPQKQLNDAWTLVMGGQFHDTGAGTATPRAYEFAQNDDLIAANQFADVLTGATRSVASLLDTRVQGTPILVYNPLNIEREDIVEAILPAGATENGVAVFSPDGKEVPAQLENGKVVFLARVPSVGYAVYDVRPSHASAPSTDLKVTPSSLENARYKVTLNASGDVANIFDKTLGKELLASPMRLAISNDAPKQWPAWNMDFDQEQAAPRAYIGGSAEAHIVENGPARVAVQVTRSGQGSRFVQTVRLSSGDAGNRVEFTESIDWRSLAANLKAVFPLTAKNDLATYNWEVGTIQRPVAFDRQFEVASHHWIDQTDQSGTFGATLLTDVKNGSDKRDNSTLRLTLLRSPGEASEMKGSYTDQLNQDWGHHEILFGLAGHAGDWRQTHTDWQAYRLSTPLIAFNTQKHAGPLGRTYSLLTVDNPAIRILALKKAESSNEIMVRLVELDGKSADNVKLQFAGPLQAAREVNGQELPLGPATITHGALETSFKPYQPRTFALTLGAPRVHAASISSQSVPLHYDLAAASNDDTPSVGGFDQQGNALPAEMLPSSLLVEGVPFALAPAATGKPNALAANGQSVALPKGNFNTLYLLAASSAGDQQATFTLGQTPTTLAVQNWGGFIGQWDTRQWKPRPATVTEGGGNSGAPVHQVALRQDFAVSANHQPWDLKSAGSPDWAPKYPQDYLGLAPGFIKPATLAWYASHHHNAQGLNVPYQYSYLFLYALHLPAATKTLTLPSNPSIKIMAVSVAATEPELTPAQPLFDDLGNTTEPAASTTDKPTQ